MKNTEQYIKACNGHIRCPATQNVMSWTAKMSWLDQNQKDWDCLGQ